MKWKVIGHVIIDEATIQVNYRGTMKQIDNYLTGLQNDVASRITDSTWTAAVWVINIIPE